MTSAPQDVSPPLVKKPDLPPFTSHNSPSLPTILFIHGGGVTGANWDLLLPHLTTYHILLPTLPQHGTNPNPLTLTTATSQLASLIQSHANNGVAHIVGHSLGTHIALDLAETHPSIVSTVFISGFGIYSGNPIVPYVLWSESRLNTLIPTSVMKWAMDGTDMEECAPSDLSGCKAVSALITPGEWPKPWGQRTLVVVAGKGGIIPSADSKVDARKLVSIGRKRCEETKAVVHAGMRHPWNRQDPKLFAEAVVSWIEERDLPKGFVDLQ